LNDGSVRLQAAHCTSTASLRARHPAADAAFIQPVMFAGLPPPETAAGIIIVDARIGQRSTLR